MLDADATVAVLSAQPSRTAVLVDFDGSIAPIVADPDSARPLPGMLDVLDRLSRRVARVGVVSGRPVSFLAAHVPLRRVVLVGQYGLEQLVGGAVVVDARALPYVTAVAHAAARLEAALPTFAVERKGEVSVTAHWRRIPERAAEVDALAEELHAELGLELYRSRMAAELRPPVGIHKGDAVRALVDGCAAAAFAGDDRGDLSAFDALSLVARETGLAAVRVGVHSPEAPPELVAAVDVLVDGPAGLLALLARVADQIG